MFHTLRYNGHYIHLAYTRTEGERVHVQHAETHKTQRVGTLHAAKMFITMNWKKREVQP